MAHVVLFHHAQGLRPDVVAWAESFREAGHEVHAPDLYEGATFDRLEDGIAHRDEVGIPTLMQRVGEFLDGLPEDLVYAGFSMGATTAHYFAVTRPGARGALLMHGTAPPQALGGAEWPTAPAQLHYSEGDPWVDTESIAAFERSVRDAGSPLDVFTYPGDGHLFADPDGPDYDEGSAKLMLERELDFLSKL
ncbi:MAG TPA: dienelactone hydrolase family protein [Solirubrobacterales bacterium]|jgi:dienelactone hydrolase